MSKQLWSMGFGTVWGQTETWSSAVGAANNGFAGNGMILSQLPYLLNLNGGNTIAVVTGAGNTRYFDLSGGVYVARFFLQDILTHDTANSQYVLTDPTGAQVRFNDWSVGLAALKRGQFKSYTDAYGNVTSVTSWTSDGRP
jgi:hypothetical protein